MKFSRRMFLGGAGAMIALPFLESLLPRGARAAAPAVPKRFVGFFVPNGMEMANWTPIGEGTTYTLPQNAILAPLMPYRDKVLIPTGLDNPPARPNPGPGDHGSGAGAFMTCVQVEKTEGADIRNGMSADQVAAQTLGTGVRYRSLELGIEAGASVGGCDSGYSCAYTRNISWAG